MREHQLATPRGSPRLVQPITPACLEKPDAARYCSISEAAVEKLLREDNFPKPRLLTSRRVGYLVRELDAWLEDRPVADLLPPENTGAKKPRRSATSALAGAAPTA